MDFKKNLYPIIIILTENIKKCIDDKQIACGVHEKVFDTVDDMQLLNKLSYYGIRILQIGCSKKKKNFMASFYGQHSTAPRLEPLQGGSLLFTTKFPEISGTHFIDLGRMKG